MQCSDGDFDLRVHCFLKNKSRDSPMLPRLLRKRRWGQLLFFGLRSYENESSVFVKAHNFPAIGGDDTDDVHAVIFLECNFDFSA